MSATRFRVTKISLPGLAVGNALANSRSEPPCDPDSTSTPAPAGSWIVPLGCAITLAGIALATIPGERAKSPPAWVIPRQVGSWRLVDSRPLPENDRKLLEATRSWQRTYRCRESRWTVTATMVAGPSGPIAAHSPEICFRRKDFRQVSQPRRHALSPREPAEFWFLTLAPRNFEDRAVTIAYSWHNGKTWCAPRLPRWQLAATTSVRRLQVTARHPAGVSSAARDRVTDFLRLATTRCRDETAVDTACGRRNATSRVDP